MRAIRALIYFGMLLGFINCGSSGKSQEEVTEKVTTPVTISFVRIGPIKKVICMTATTAYLKKNMVRSVSTGYITKTFFGIGDFVKTGTPLFSVKTKEAEALSSYAKDNPDFTFSGEMTIKSPSSGIITEVTKQDNDYVTDGDQLCIIAEQSSLVFLLNVPFEQIKYTVIGTTCSIILPDSTRIKGTITSKLSAIDPLSQTQNYVIKPQTGLRLPENLLASAELSESMNTNAQVADKQCVLTDETMEHYWVMKLVNDSTAVKIMLKPGIVTDKEIEIVSPLFGKNDRLINSGHYGLPDTAMVNIIHP